MGIFIIDNMNLPSKRKHLVCSLIAGSLILIYQFYLWCLAKNDLQYKTYNISRNIRNYRSTKRPMKYILQWTLPNTEPFVFWGRGQEQFMKRKCKVNNCYVTYNRSYFSSICDFDAVAFHGPEISRPKYLKGPNKRCNDQKYVFVSQESSHYYPICDERYDGYFNWTWTYQLDSNVTYRYMNVRNINGKVIGPNKIMNWISLESMKPIDIDTKAVLARKSKAAAWFVSNCKSLSLRENYVLRLRNKLRKYALEIDIFGKCSWANKKCPKENNKMCLKMIQDDYYFYLSLENSFSEDYVTEKLLTPLQNYAVPIVFGAANYTRFMPDGIYLHAGKMKPENLAEEINDIITDTERYYNFFKWRNHYSYHDRYSPDTDPLCKLCEMLNDESLMATKKVYTDFRKWWNVPGMCKIAKR